MDLITLALSKDYTDKQVEKIQLGGIDSETIKQAVDEYMTKNPVNETDPTVPDWAKQPSKPTYTAAEVGAMPADGGDLELIYNTKTTEALAQLKVTKDNNGNPFELTKLLVIIKLPYRNTAREAAYRISCGDESTAWHYLNVPATANGWSFYIEQDATMHWGEYTSYKDGTYNSRAVADAGINYNPSRRCTLFTFYSLNEPDFEIYIFGRRA